MAPLQTSDGVTVHHKENNETPDRIEQHHTIPTAADILGNDDGSAMQQFYKDKTIFLTGATGFLGKIIMEKLLRACDVATIYILVRSKKGKSMEARCEEIFDDVVFDRLKQLAPKFRHKIVAIAGDCMLPELGMAAGERRRLVAEVNVVFHVAATVRFDEKLRLALSINVAGTREIMVLAQEMGALRALVHVSTAYANCNRRTIDEQIYRPYLSAENAVKLASCLDDKTMDGITGTILKDWPNTYTFTKCLAEDLVRNMSKGMPVTIFRPAIVIPTYKEPVAGWIDNMYGPTGIVVGVGSGLLRVLYAIESNNAELVPVDMCVNAMLAAAWDVATADGQSYEEPPVYNYVASPQNPITWKEYCEYGITHGSKMPMIKAIWHYNFRMSSSRTLVWLMTFFYHVVPAFVMDAGLVVSGRKPKILQVYKKIHKFCDILGYFTTNTWHFSNTNVQRLWTKLSPADRELFFFNMADMNWSEAINLSIFGIRTYLMKEEPSTIPAALKRAQRLKVLHYGTLLVAYSLVAFLVYTLLMRFI